MPKKCSAYEQRLEAERRRERAVQRAHFERSFRRSTKGNLWRNYDGRRLTIFTRNDGDYGWIIAVDGSAPQFSKNGYDTEEEAMQSLWIEVS